MPRARNETERESEGDEATVGTAPDAADGRGSAAGAAGAAGVSVDIDTAEHERARRKIQSQSIIIR
jgi:hypothetical protein